MMKQLPRYLLMYHKKEEIIFKNKNKKKDRKNQRRNRRME
jgi:hypothetical protein